MARKIKLNKKESSKKLKPKSMKVLKKRDAELVDLRPLQPAKIDLGKITSKKLEGVSENELIALHLRMHQLYEGIKGSLGGVRTEAFIAEAIANGKTNILISTGFIKTKLPVYLLAEGKALALLELEAPTKIAASKVNELVNFQEAKDVIGFESGNPLFAYTISSMEKFEESRPFNDDRRNQPIVKAVKLLGIMLKLTLGDIIKVHALIIKEIKSRSLFHNVITELDIKTKLLLRIGIKINPFEKDNSELIKLHKRAHTAYRKATESGDTVSIAKAQALHALVTAELNMRDLPHLENADGFDLINKGYVEGSAIGETKIIKKKKMKSKEIVLENVLDYFGSFDLRSPYVSIVGDIAENGTTEKNVDILIQDSNVLPLKSRQLLELQILKMLPLVIQKRINFHYNDFSGKTEQFVSLFDLKIQKADEDPEEENVKSKKVIKTKPAKKLKVLKQKDPFMDLPKEGADLDYVVQAHFVGNSVHHDLRMECIDPESLLGWTLETEISGIIKEPVLKLSEAKELDVSRYSKINWANGQWLKTRNKMGGGPRIAIRAKSQGLAPIQWKEVQGVIEPGMVGANTNFPGVFLIADKGKVEYGAQKPWFHEYFFNGEALDSKVVFRKLNFSISTEKFMQFVNEDNELNELFFDKLYDKNLGKIIEKAIVQRSRPSSFVEENEQFISPAVNLGEVETESGWVAIKTAEQTPHVLSNDSMEKKWIPPLGFSALPENIKTQIPKKFKYWEKEDATAALKTRDALVKSLRSKKLKLNIPTNKQKADVVNAQFVLQRQTWEEAIVAGETPTKDLFDIRVDAGTPTLLHFRLNGNPLKKESVITTVDRETDKDRMKLKGTISPETPLNPTKDNESKIVILDKGQVSIVDSREGFVKMEFAGKKFKGLWTAESLDGEWTFERSELKFAETREAEIAKVHDGTDKRLVTAIALKPEDRDSQGHIYSKEIIEQAAYDFVAGLNRTSSAGLMHSIFDRNIEVVESWLVPEDMTIFGKFLKAGTWIVTLRVNDLEIWRMIKKGVINAVSIGGIAAAVSG